MRVTLLTDGGYPHRVGGTAGWCDRLVTASPQHTYHVTTLVEEDGATRAAYQLPRNVAALTALPLAGRAAPAGRGDTRRLRRRATTAAAVLLCRGMLGPGPTHASMFAAGLRALADQADGGHPLTDVPLADVLLDAARARRTVEDAEPAPDSPPLPRLSLRDARHAAGVLHRATGALAARPADTDLSHAVGGGAPLLAALAIHWRTGIPYLLTELEPHLRQQSLAGPDGPPAPVRAVLLRFHRALARLGYAEARLVAPASRFHQRWAVRHGAPASRVVVVPPGADPAGFAPVRTEPERPTIIWTGEPEPRADLPSLLRAFRLVRQARPAAALELIGASGGAPAAAGHSRLLADLVADPGLADAVRVHPAPADDRRRYASGHVVAVAGDARDAPLTLIQAMLCGRATVGVDVGPVAEILGGTGLVVPPADPAALAAACLTLLDDARLRRELGDAARRRALAHYTTERMARVYDALYRDVAAAPAVPAVAQELPVRMPASRWTGAPLAGRT